MAGLIFLSASSEIKVMSDPESAITLIRFSPNVFTEANTETAFEFKKAQPGGRDMCLERSTSIPELEEEVLAA